MFTGNVSPVWKRNRKRAGASQASDNFGELLMVLPSGLGRIIGSCEDHPSAPSRSREIVDYTLLRIFFDVNGAMKFDLLEEHFWPMDVRQNFEDSCLTQTTPILYCLAARAEWIVFSQERLPASNQTT